MPTFNLQAIAREMKAAQDDATAITPFTSRFSDFDLPAAYEVARLIHVARVAEGAVPAGRKIGFTNPGVWSAFGIQEPAWAYVYDKTVVHYSTARTKCYVGGFLEPKIEPEIIVHFRTPPPVTHDIAEILECIDWIAHGFEIVQSHFSGWKFQVADTVADGVLHAALLVGEPQEIGSFESDLALTLERFSVTLRCNATVREVGKGANVLGSPLSALASLIAVLASQPRSPPIQAGELVTTGTLTAALPIHGGETWSTVLEGIALPGMAVEFEE